MTGEEEGFYQQKRQKKEVGNKLFYKCHMDFLVKIESWRPLSVIHLIRRGVTASTIRQCIAPSGPDIKKIYAFIHEGEVNPNK